MDTVMFEASNSVNFEKDQNAASKAAEEETEEVQIPLMNENELSIANNKQFSRLPERSPIDMRFENITFTASLGWRKGKKLTLQVHTNTFK